MIPAFAEASLPPELAVARPSLAAAVPTTMLFVDYALAGLTTPTYEHHTLAAELPREVVDASWPIRAALAHGSYLRGVTLAQLPADHPGHREWPALRGWYEALDDDRILGLVQSGVRSVLALGNDEPEPMPPHEVSGMVGTLGDLTREGAQVLEIWGVTDPAKRVAELLDPALVRSTLLGLLDEIWSRWLGPTWTDQLAALDASYAAAPTPPPGADGGQWIKLVSGLVPTSEYAAAADQARRVVLMPCPGMERSLSQFPIGEDLYVLYSPQTAAPTSGRRQATVQAKLDPVMQALGDQTRLAIVLRLLDGGPLTMQELTDALQVHQTTISRQVAALRKARLVSQDDQRRVNVNREEIRDACRLLLDAVS